MNAVSKDRLKNIYEQNFVSCDAHIKFMSNRYKDTMYKVIDILNKCDLKTTQISKLEKLLFPFATAFWQHIFDDSQVIEHYCREDDINNQFNVGYLGAMISYPCPNKIVEELLNYKLLD